MSNIEESLFLREFEPIDCQAVHEYASDQLVVQYMEWGPNTLEETQTYIQRAIASSRQQLRTDYEFAVILATNNQLIGSCSIYISNIVHKEGCIGYCFNRQFWGQGYATTAAHSVVKFGFEKLNLHLIFATCDPLNFGSQRVMEKIGMQFEVRLRENKWAKEKWRDSLVYAILKSEWQHTSQAITAPIITKIN